MIKRALFVFAALIASNAYAADYRITYAQDGCEDVASWELWGGRAGATPGLVFTIPKSAVTCPADPATPIVVVASGKLRNGLWSFAMRAIGDSGEQSDWSDALVVQFPLPKPKLLKVEK